jgi:hypothetical protein
MNGQQQQQQYQQDPAAFEEVDEPPPEASFAIDGISSYIKSNIENLHGI